MPTIHNPVLRGFHPDPSICRVGDDFYIATSTFEWFPGVMIYSSRTLCDWRLVARPLDRRSQLDMAGNPPSGGIWAPCLSYADERFWLIYTDVKEWVGSRSNDGFKDSLNYVVTAATIEGPWSEPRFLNASGFDPSLFHDEDGRKWLVNVKWDYRPGRNSFGGIVLQEYDARAERLVGPIRSIFPGTEIGYTEAPHLYRRAGWYYLMTAEGGTSYGHAVVLARSRTIDGPYELHPQTPLITSVADRCGFDAAVAEEGDIRPHLETGLQKAGHGSMARWDDRQWVLAHLCGRPVADTLNCPLGRETALQVLEWRSDGWPWPASRAPQWSVAFAERDVPAGDGGSEPPRTPVWRDDFDGPTMAAELNTLREPVDDRFDLSARPGWLRLRGALSPTSRFRQTIAARRVQAFDWRAETRIDAAPDDFQQLAGLIVRYDEDNQYLLRLSAADRAERCLGIVRYVGRVVTTPLGDDEVPLQHGAVDLAVEVSGKDLNFFWRQGGAGWSAVGPTLDASLLSDDTAEPLGFTGTFVGIGCWDASGRGLVADFDYLEYCEE